MYIGDIQSKLKNRLKQHLYINTIIKQHSSNSSGMQRYYKIIIYPRCYVILMKLYSQYISSVIPLWFKNILFCSSAELGQPQSWCKGHTCSQAGPGDSHCSHHRPLVQTFAFDALLIFHHHLTLLLCSWPGRWSRNHLFLSLSLQEAPMTHSGCSKFLLHS